MQKLIEMKNKKGFTLIEMLIVILIIVILLAIAVPAVAAYRRDALRTQDEGAVETIRTALESTLIRETPGDLGVNEGTYTTISGVLNYNTLLSGDPADAKNDAFYKLLADYLGPNFQGNFRFGYNSSNDAIMLVSYWRSDSATGDDSVMFFHRGIPDFKDPIYLSEGTGANSKAYRPT